MTLSTHRRILPFLAIAVAAGAFGAAGAQVVEVPAARKLEGWPSVQNLSHDGSVYFAGQPDAVSLRRLAREGVRAVLNVREPSELEHLGFSEAAVVQEAGMQYFSIPLTVASFSTEQVDRLAEVLRQVEGPVLLHCGSSNRAGGLWAAYLARHRGVDLDRAIDLGKAAGLSSESMIDAVLRVAAQP